MSNNLARSIVKKKRRIPMQRNMKQWLEELRQAKVKKPLPILSYPAIQ